MEGSVDRILRAVHVELPGMASHTALSLPFDFLNKFNNWKTPQAIMTKFPWSTVLQERIAFSNQSDLPSESFQTHLR